MYPAQFERGCSRLKSPVALYILPVLERFYYKLRSNMDAPEYKHVVLGLLFLKHFSDAFTEVHEELKKDPTSDPEDVDEYISRRVFFPESWSTMRFGFT